MNQSEVITISGLEMRFPGCDALRGVDLTVNRGSVFAILGENGAGKTTMIRILTGFQKPTSGSCRVCGLDPMHDSLQIRRRIGYVSDSPALYDWMTVSEIGWFTASFYAPGYVEQYVELVHGFEIPADRKIKLLIAVGYAQWFSQLIRNPILRAICAPIVVGIAIFSIVFAMIEVQTKYASVLLLILPFFATFVMMRRWMDRRFRWSFWCFHLSLILLALSLPLAEAAWRISRVPTMPGEVKQALRKEASEILPRNNPSAHTIPTLSLVSPSLSSFFGDGTLAVGLEPRIELALRGPATDELIELLEQSITSQPQSQISYILAMPFIKAIMKRLNAACCNSRSIPVVITTGRGCVSPSGFNSFAGPASWKNT